MFDRPYVNDPPVKVTPDQFAVIKTEIRELVSAMRFLVDGLAEDKGTSAELIHNILYVSEARLAQISQITGIETDSATMREQRYVQLREANEKIRSLEAQLGATVTPAYLKQSVALMSDKLNAWWRNQGMGLIREESVNSAGNFVATLSCTPFGPFSLMNSRTPISDTEKRKAWRQSWESRGLVFCEGRGNLESVVACSSSRAALTSLVCRTFPSATIRGYDSRNSGQPRNTQVLADLRICIDDIEDIARLPDVGSYPSEA